MFYRCFLFHNIIFVNMFNYIMIFLCIFNLIFMCFIWLMIFSFSKIYFFYQLYCIFTYFILYLYKRNLEGVFMNQDNKIMNLFSRIVDLLLLNFLFVITSLPVLTLGASLTALFSVSLKLVRNEESYVSRDYFRAFKKNFCQATVSFWAFSLIIALLAGNLMISFQQAGNFYLVLRMISFLFMIFIGIYFLYFFPVLARFYFTTRQILLHIPHMIFTHFSDFVLLVVLLIPLIFFSVYSLFTAICIVVFGCVCGFSVCAYVMSMLFRRIFEPYEISA